MKEGITINAQSSIRIEKDNVITYFDPYLIEKEVHDADYLFITHDHYDHLSIEDINKVVKEETIIIVPESCYTKVEELPNEIIQVKPNTKYVVDNIKFQTVAAYNTNKAYHPENNGWVGYVVELENKSYYVTGDTDINKENKMVKCDILFVPVGGVYTTTAEEAATLTNLIHPKLAIPTHYQTIVGTKVDAINYTKLVKSDIDTELYY